MDSSFFNLVDSVIDEVALEGLDGITLEALSQRLCVRLKEESPLPHAFMEQLWSIIIQIPDFEFYKLKEPREKLTIIDHFALFDQDTPEQDMPIDMYEHHPINDTKNKIRGSCKSYHTRMLITETAKRMSLEEIIFEYGQHFVIVASQELREHALVSDTAYPLVELNEMQYCMLERIGRARHCGELSQKKMGPYSNEDPKIMFYLRKALLQHKLITKQMFHHVGCNRTYSGNLLHLARFYVEKRPSTVSVLDNVINLLKSKPNYLAEYEEIKKLLPSEKPLNKIVRANFLPKIFHMDLRIPYRSLYPDAEPKDYMQKNQAKEKMLRVVQLVDPNFSMDSLSAKEENEEEEPYEISMQNQKLFIPLVKQAYSIVEEGKNEGLSQMEFAKIIGATRLQSRSMLRNLSKTNSITTMMRDIGRQRVTKYVSRKFEKTSEYNKQFKEEIDKIKEFTKNLKKTPTKRKARQDDEPVIHEENFTLEAPPVPVSKVADPLSFASVSKKRKKQSLSMDLLDFSEDHESGTTSPSATDGSLVPEETNPEEYVVLDSEAPATEPETETTLVNDAVYVDVAMNTNEDEIEESEEVSEDGVLQKKKDKLNRSVYDKIEVKMIVQKPMKIEKDASDVVGFMEELKNRGEKQTPNMTYRLLKRANLVITMVKEQKVISNLAKIRRVIEDEELGEGYPVRMDKRSLLRMLHKLAKDNFVKFIKVTMSFNDILKVVTFICDPSVTQEDSLLVSAIEKAKIEFCSATLCKVQGNKKVFDKLDDGSKVKLTRFTRQLMKSDIHVQPDYNAGKKYGFSPKFIRMRHMHSLLYYLVYEHPGEPQVSREMQLESLREQGNILDDDLIKEMNKIYHDEVDWKMFVPPLPKHADWPQGWSLLCDVIFRMPLSLFVKIVKVPYILPELESYLNHPVRRHFLLKDVPLTLQNIILQGRKYIFTIHSVLTRLCYIGLVQFGPQKLKEKDQVFVFVNRRAELWDTTTSAPGYHHIEEDKEYPVQKYFFDSMAVVEKYWYDMWNYCINTNLGGRLAVQGKDIVLEDLDKKLLMIYTLSPREPGEAITKDLGFTPGDRKGAAGLDSALFAHLKRNWNWGEDYYRCKQYKNGGRSSSPPPKEPITVNISELAKPSGQKKVYCRKRHLAMQQIEQDLILLPRRRSFIRKVLPKKKRQRARVKYDEVDHCALQRMEKLRVDWEPHEDNVLLVCKVAMMYLCPNNRKQLVPFSAVRDVLYQYAKSNNKTSKACHRRVVYMMKQPKTVNSVHLGVEEIRQDYHVHSNFNEILDRVKGECDISNYQARICEIFKQLVDYIINKYYNISNMELRNPISIPMSIEQFYNTYTIKHPKKHPTSQSYFKDIGEVEDIHAATINSVIHSSMCCGKDRRSWAYELFKIYQQYPEYMLRKAMLKIRGDQMVSVKKSYVCAIKKYTHCMPMSSSQYQFSTNYMHKFQTKWPYEIYREADQVMHKIVVWHSENQKKELNYVVPEFVRGLEVNPVTGGVVAIIHDLMTQNLLEIDVEIPEQVLTLDPRLNEKDEVYVRIAKRYHALLRDLENTPVEVEDESEISQPSTVEIEEVNEVSQPKKVRFQEPIDDSENEPVAVSASPAETQAVLKYTSVSQIIQNHNSKNRKIFKTRKDDSKQKSHTRIAMLKMREELSELTFKDSHHAHEYFAVNSFKILYSLKLQKEDKSRRMETFKGVLVPHEIIPIDDDVSKRILNKVKENATFPIVQTSYEDFKEEMKDILGIPWTFVDEVYYFIKEKKEFGASLSELITNYYPRLRETLQDILSLLMKERLILRSGITSVRYIHQMYTDPWLIHSYKILRLDREARTPFPENTMFLPGDQQQSNDQVTAGEKECDSPETVTTQEPGQTQDEEETEKENENLPESNDEVEKEGSESNESSESRKRKADENVEEGNEDSAPKRPCRRRTSLVQQKDIYKSAKMLDLTSAEKIKVVIKPWIRVDGVLNHRVLDRMLGAVLSYCVKHPGVSLSRVQTRFAPALQPFHARELVEILADLECVTTMTLRVSKATLFSKTPTYDLSSKSDLATEDEMIIEPVLGATLKFSTFLNNRSYGSDFLS